MVWFQCEDCGETLKKPKLSKHIYQCSAMRFSCIDCLQVFTRAQAQEHVSCVTEKEKYVLGVTKAGGAAAQNGGCVPVPGSLDEKYTAPLSVRPPWTCSACNVTCTSRETLMGHASGKKHQSKCRAIARATAEATTEAATTGGEEKATPVVVEEKDADKKEEEQEEEKRKKATKEVKDEKKRKRGKMKTMKEGKRKSEGGESKEKGGTKGNGKSMDDSVHCRQHLKVKWKKFAAEELNRAKGGQLDLDELLTRVIKSSALKATAEVRLAALQKMASSKQFVIQGGSIKIHLS